MRPAFRALPPRSALLLLIPLTACGRAGESPPTAPAETVWGVLEPEASFAEGFTYLGDVREKSDGRLLVADPPGQVLLRLDLEAGSADTLGREGQGPAEYHFPDRVFPLPGDSSLLVDLGNGRLGVLAPDDVFTDWLPVSRDTGDGQTRTILPAAVDGAGRLYRQDAYPPAGDPPDSVRILRFERGGGAGTTVAWSWRPEPEPWDRNDKRPILTPMDAWGVGQDGRVAVARAEAFAVDWYLPDGRIVQGRRYEVDRYPVGTEEAEAEMARMMEGAIVTTSVVDQDGVQSRRMRRGVPSGAGFTMDDFAWPEELPLVRYGGTLVTPWGDAWVTRVLPQGMAPRVEVFDSAGSWRGFIELPEASEVVGFGHTSEGTLAAYLVRTDEMGLKWLSRHRVRAGGEELP